MEKITEKRNKMRKLSQKLIRPIDVIVVGVVGLVAVIIYPNQILLGVLFGLLLIDGLVSLVNERK